MMQGVPTCSEVLEAAGCELEQRLYFTVGMKWVGSQEKPSTGRSNINSSNHNNNLGFYGSVHGGTQNTLQALTH